MTSSSIFLLANPLFAFNEEGVETQTSLEQKKLEKKISYENLVLDHLPNLPDEIHHAKFVLRRKVHIKYVLSSLYNLPKAYDCMDASRPWFCFWGLHSLRLLGYKPDKELSRKIIAFLKSCEGPNGGYGGGPGQISHLATTYASVMALVSIGTESSLASIDCVKLKKFLMFSRKSNGSFTMHSDGEVDIRGAYCAISTAVITGIADSELFDGTASWIMRCQSYEGGFSGEPNCEAHGGYTYCGVTSLALLQKTNLFNADRILNWVVKRQMQFEGGFNGRVNKLVDGCYSFWQAAIFSTLEYELSNNLKKKVHSLLNYEALQNYILVICQGGKDGGFRDKPSKQPDLYHTCYVLSGLSIAQSYADSPESIVGGKDNRLELLDPFFNVCVDQKEFAKCYFSRN